MSSEPWRLFWLEVVSLADMMYESLVQHDRRHQQIAHLTASYPYKLTNLSINNPLSDKSVSQSFRSNSNHDLLNAVYVKKELISFAHICI